jgi:hypothetical protein
MVIGEKFAWAHLPKTGGMATEQLFRIFDELIVFADRPHTNDMHVTFSAREGQVRGKQLAMNVRRLPSWVLSRAQHVARCGIWPDYKPMPMQSPEVLAESSFPDSRMLLYTSNGRFRIEHWLKMETLADDFLAFIAKFVDVTDDQRGRVVEMGRVNAHDYEHELSRWFTPKQIATMYARNPAWTAVEREVYGGLLIPSGAAE